MDRFAVRGPESQEHEVLKIEKYAEATQHQKWSCLRELSACVLQIFQLHVDMSHDHTLFTFPIGSAFFLSKLKDCTARISKVRNLDRVPRTSQKRRPSILRKASGLVHLWAMAKLVRR